MALREDRQEENQKRFRRLNERLGEVVGDRVTTSEPLPFLCECPDEECTDAVELTLEQYAQVHADPRRFVVVKGHPLMEGEQRISEDGKFEVVEKP